MIVVLFRKQIIVASFRTENVLDSHFSFQKKKMYQSFQKQHWTPCLLLLCSASVSFSVIISYEHNKRCEKQEQFFQKFRDTIMLEESHHVCSDKPHIPALRFRGHPHKSQMDVSCGGSKLTPITRTLSSSSMLPMTPSAKQRHSLKSAEGSGRRESRLRQDGRHFPAPKSRVKREKSWSGWGDGTGSGKWTRSQESLWSAESSDTGNGERASELVWVFNPVNPVG